MDVKTTSVLEVQIKFTGIEAERLTALAERQGVGADVLLYRAVEAFLARSAENEIKDRDDWQALGLTAFQRDWDNADDAIYDEWRIHYGMDAR